MPLYCVTRNLTFRALAAVLDVSRLAAYNYCRAPRVKIKYLHILCNAEAMSFADYFEAYRSRETEHIA